MYIPVRCFTCGKVLGNKWNYYVSEVNKLKEGSDDSIINVNAKNLKKTPECIVLDRLELNMYCCRRIMLGHVAIGDKI
mgnify:FL=1